MIYYLYEDRGKPQTEPFIDWRHSTVYQLRLKVTSKITNFKFKYIQSVLLQAISE